MALRTRLAYIVCARRRMLRTTSSRRLRSARGCVQSSAARAAIRARRGDPLARAGHSGTLTPLLPRVDGGVVRLDHTSSETIFCVTHYLMHSPLGTTIVFATCLLVFVSLVRLIIISSVDHFVTH